MGASQSGGRRDGRVTRAGRVARAEIAIAVVAILVALASIIGAPTFVGGDGPPPATDVLVGAGLGVALAGLAWMIRTWRHSPEDHAPAWRSRRGR
jgi:hypothetical protein